MRPCNIFLIYILIPLLIFDGQILFNYGIFKNKHLCNEIRNNEIIQLRRALKYPINIPQLPTNISFKYYTTWISTHTEEFNKGKICFLWNIVDTFLYAFIPFIITLICSFIIIVKVCQRRRSIVVQGGTCHTNRDFIISPRDHLSTLLITTNIVFFLMTSPFNICLIGQSIFECWLLRSSSSSFVEIFICLNEYLRLLQNSYHALSFILYCFIGNKFRSSAKSIARTIYSKFIDYGVADQCTETSVFSCCLDRRHSSSSGQAVSTNSRLSDNRRLTIESRSTNLLPLNTIRRPTYVTYDNNQKATIHAVTPL